MRKYNLVTSCIAVAIALSPCLAKASATLYGISLNGFISTDPGPSSLYSIDPTTGFGTLIGTDLGHAVNAIAVDPTSGILYGSTTSWSGPFNGLLQIDPITGTAIEIGEFGDNFTSIVGLSIDSNGNLFAWHEPDEDDPVAINIVTGAATTVGESAIGIDTAGHVLAFDSSDTLTLVNNFDVFDINTATGEAAFSSTLSFDPGLGGGAFDPSTGLLWAPGTPGGAQDSAIRVSNLAANSFIDIDTNVEFLNAVTFDPTTIVVPEPNVFVLCVGLVCCSSLAMNRRR